MNFCRSSVTQAFSDAQNTLGLRSLVIWCLRTIYTVFDSGLGHHQLMIATTEEYKKKSPTWKSEITHVK